MPKVDSSRDKDTETSVRDKVRKVLPSWEGIWMTLGESAVDFYFNSALCWGLDDGQVFL